MLPPAPLPSTMAAPPATLTRVPSHHSADSGARSTTACNRPAQMGLLPMATAVPTPTPAICKPA